MIIAALDPTIPHELTFDLNISGSNDEPSDIRFIIEAQIDPETGNSVQDVFSIICRAVRSADGVKITIPRLLNLFRSGSYKSRLEVVLENRLFVPLSEEIMILEPAKVEMKNSIKEAKPSIPDVSVSISNIVAEMVKPKEEPVVQEPTLNEEPKPEPKPFLEKAKPVDKSWRDGGFVGIRNPFKDSKNISS
jgi:hypothetical protein